MLNILNIKYFCRIVEIGWATMNIIGAPTLARLRRNFGANYDDSPWHPREFLAMMATT